tara:strand:+ start:285 stop:521 length:237 start_codon:yes stop_codon:yes gene_type:complete
LQEAAEAVVQELALALVFLELVAVEEELLLVMLLFLELLTLVAAVAVMAVQDPILKLVEQVVQVLLLLGISFKLKFYV